MERPWAELFTENMERDLPGPVGVFVDEAGCQVAEMRFFFETRVVLSNPTGS